MYRAPRGTVDILPAGQGYYRYVESRAAEVCRLYGYQRIDTPVFEDSGLFVRTIGQGTDIVEKEMYSFEDRGGQSLTLRPEGTAPVCRAYLEHGMHNLPQPVRLYYFAAIFRYERPQKGRYRQHQQFGAEAIGDGDPALDAEVIEMAWRFFKSLRLRRLSLLVNSIGCRQCRPAYLQRLVQHYSRHADSLCPDCRSRLKRNPLRLLDCKQPSCQAVAASAPKSAEHLCPECAEHFREVLRDLKQVGVPFKRSHRLVRGLDYYTRTVFEIQPRDEEGAQSALGGGGRYDDLIEELGGRPTPAIGFASGIERIALSLREQKVIPPDASSPAVFIACMGQAASVQAARLAAELRGCGLAVQIGTGSRSLKAQMRQANTLGVARALIIGEDEVARGTVVYRDMARGRQREVATQDIAGLLSAG